MYRPIKYVVLIFVILTLAACASVQTTSTVEQQIREQEARLPDFREEARLGIDRGEKMVQEGQAMLDDGRRQVRNGQEMIASGTEIVQRANLMLAESSGADVAAHPVLEQGIRMIREGNALVTNGNKMIANGQDTIRRGRERLTRSLEQLREAQS